MQFTQDMSKPILEHSAAVRVTMNSGISEEAEIVSEISRREIDSQVLLTMDGIIFEVTDAMKSSLISKPLIKVILTHGYEHVMVIQLIRTVVIVPPNRRWKCYQCELNSIGKDIGLFLRRKIP